MATEKTEVHYKVDARIDGHWFSNLFVFLDKESAVAYGETLPGEAGVAKYRLVETDRAVNLPAPDIEDNV